MGTTFELESYGIRAVTEGKDALGEVSVRISSNGRLFAGRGVSTDIIEASIKAYINAINRSLSEAGNQAENINEEDLNLS